MRLALPFLTSGLEALLKVGRQELTKQFKRRVTGLAELLDIDGVNEAFCERMYDGRSARVHGAAVALFAPPKPAEVEAGATGPEGTEQVDRLAEVALLQDVLRKAVRRCIEDDEIRTVFANDTAIQERWPL